MNYQSEQTLTFSDVLLVPQFSRVESRKDVKLEQSFLGTTVSTPIMNSNMDTIASTEMAEALLNHGAMPTLHRFQGIESNVQQFKQLNSNNVVCSIGVSNHELDRALALYNAGCSIFLVDVAHAASTKVVKFYDLLRNTLGKDANIIVGNFATGRSINDFLYHSRYDSMAAIKIGIGSGGVCQTRTVTGHGYPMLSSVMDCASARTPMIADGGHTTTADIAKSLAVGAKMVMLGSMLAGTDECPGELIDLQSQHGQQGKLYRGSASSSSYEAQGKLQDYIAAEGAVVVVPHKGPVSKVIKEIDGGLRSALSYSNSFTLDEFRDKVKLVKVSNNTVKENGVHTEGVKL